MWGFKRFSAWVPVPWLSIKAARRREEQESGDSRNAKVLGCRDGPQLSQAGLWLDEGLGSSGTCRISGPGRLGSGQGSLSCPACQALAFLQVEANELLDAPAVLQLCRTAARQRAWLARGCLSFSHLLSHAGQAKPGGGEQCEMTLSPLSHCSFYSDYVPRALPDSQCDNVSIRCLNGDGQWILLLLVQGMLVSPPLQE